MTKGVNSFSSSVFGASYSSETRGVLKRGNPDAQNKISRS
jgi:hypothetical protein